MEYFKHFYEYFTPRTYLYIICAIHHNCPMLLTLYLWSCLPQVFGLAPLPLSRLYV